MDSEKTLQEYYNKGFSEGIRFSGEFKSEGIGAGTAAILVRDKSLELMHDDAPFMQWLKNEEFKFWSYSKGWYDNVDWLYININSKKIARGMPGIGVTKCIREHAITIDEFKTIYEIFKRYEGLDPLQML